MSINHYHSAYNIRIIVHTQNLSSKAHFLQRKGMAGEGEVREGFLCPLCMKDLGDVVQLQVKHLDIFAPWRRLLFRSILKSRTHEKIQQ